MKLTAIASVIFLTLAATGCLSTSHRIPHSALVELSRLPPDIRGDRVRVIQGYAGDEGPPPAPAVQANTGIVVIDGGGGGPGPSADSGGPRPAKLAKMDAKDAKALIIVAVAAALLLAVTEGARYDGWVKLHPMYPIHLYGPNGEYTWVPLAQLDEETANWASRAYVREGEGPWRALGRAPLDRVGFTYGVLMGGGQVPSVDGARTPGFLGHIQLGVWPSQEVGIQLDTAFAWRDDLMQNTTLDTRYALELDLMPFRAGSMHFGAYGQAGFSTRLEDSPMGNDSSSWLYGGGAMVQLELTTRLAITARAGITSAHDMSLEEAVIGLSIY
jgi:hypothetical protein